MIQEQILATISLVKDWSSEEKSKAVQLAKLIQACFDRDEFIIQDESTFQTLVSHEGRTVGQELDIIVKELEKLCPIK
ncbi:MAG: hypothetical protein J6I32_03220 [Bacteroidaceae bacterium]|nr:hypothetical protein [Bacteroidaceae bacterium]MBR1712489.1 hypothetical protein [Alloprevotella sp.]